MSLELVNLSSPTAFRGFLEAAPDSILLIDNRGRIVIANGLTERMFGYTGEEIIGQPVELLIPARYESAHVQHREAYFANPTTRPMGGAAAALTGRRKDGSEFPVEISLSPMQTDDGLLVTAAIRDITQRKLVENQLRTSLAEKEVLLKEVHHRVKNNLQVVSSMLSLQMDQVEDPRSLALFRESQSRVRSIALFHEKLYESKDLANVDVAAYLKSIVSGLFVTYGVSSRNIDIAIEAEDVRMSMDAAITSGLVVNELVSNSLKYAFPDRRKGTIRVGLRLEGSAAVLEVADDGVGFPADLDFRNASTLGLRLVCILTEQVRGQIELERKAGTRFTLRFAAGAHE